MNSNREKSKNKFVVGRITNYLPSMLIAISLILVSVPLRAEDGQYVKTAPIRTEPFETRIRTFGVLAPSVEEMSFEIPGRIERFLVDEGDRVTKGQRLAVLDSQDAEDGLRKARSNLDNAQRILDRMLKLHETGSIQTSQLDDIQAQYDQARIAFEQAELNVARCEMVAPSNGLILQQNIDSRTSVQPGQAVYVFQSDDEQWVTKVHLTDKNALLMSGGAEAEITFTPYPNDVFKGQVTKVAKVANPSDGLYTVEVAISTQGLELRPGMIAEVDLIKASDEDYSIVPFGALLDVRGIRGTVYVVDSGASIAREQNVTINSIRGTEVSVLEDLSGFAEVITHGHHGLKDQASIIVTQ